MKKIRIGTHSGTFHLDEMLAIIIVKKHFQKCHGRPVEIIRSRDSEELKKCDVLVDVGNEFDLEKFRFDHHMPGGAGQRPNGIPFAAAGLVWNLFGPSLTDYIAAGIIDQKLIQISDALDTGHGLVSVSVADTEIASLVHVVDWYNPTWEENPNETNHRFFKVLNLIEEIFERLIVNALSESKAISLMYEMAEKAQQKQLRYVVLDSYLPAENVLSTEFPEIQIYLYPDNEGLWRIRAIKKEANTFNYRKLFPESWRGKRGQDLIDITGITEANFCHPAGFMAGATSLEGAIKIVELALKS